MRRLLLVPAFVCALVVVAPAVGSADQGGTNRPYKATQTGTSTITGGTFPGPFTVVGTATNIATHLGKGTAVTHVSLTFSLPLVPCGPGGSGLSFSFTGTGTVTAANGDQLFTSFSGTGCFVQSGISTTSGTVTFVGGTGRFDDVSGSATITGTQDPSGAVENHLVGTISY